MVDLKGDYQRLVSLVKPDIYYSAGVFTRFDATRYRKFRDSEVYIIYRTDRVVNCYSTIPGGRMISQTILSNFMIVKPICHVQVSIRSKALRRDLDLI